MQLCSTVIRVDEDIVTLSIGKWIPNVGGVVKAVLFLGIIFGAWRYLSSNELANPMTLEALTPRWGESTQYISAIIYGMLGFELVSTGADEMQR